MSVFVVGMIKYLQPAFSRFLASVFRIGRDRYKSCFAFCSELCKAFFWRLECTSGAQSVVNEHVWYSRSRPYFSNRIAHKCPRQLLL